MAQHAELAAPGQRLRAERDADSEEPDHDCGDFERIGDRKGAIEERKRGRSYLAGYFSRTG